MSDMANIETWNPILDMISIPKEYYKEISFFAERVKDAFRSYSILVGNGVGSSYIGPDTTPNEFEENIVPISLQIIKKIDDLSKVKFLEAPFYFNEGEQIGLQEIKHTISVEIDEIIQIPNFIIDQTTSEIIAEISNDINKRIFEGFNILMYLPIESIYYKTEGNYIKIYYRTRYSYIN